MAEAAGTTEQTQKGLWTTDPEARLGAKLGQEAQVRIAHPAARDEVAG
jgi:hypothetical protein